jgi:hypothetical protein
VDIAIIAFEPFIVQDGADLSGPVPDITRKSAHRDGWGGPRRLRELHESGEWLRMVEPFGLAAANEPSADLTVNLPCAG